MTVKNPYLLKESEVVELKESFNNAALKTLSAFANTRGGTLYVGIKDDKTLNIEGISDEKQQDIVNKIINILGIMPSVILHNYDGIDFLEIKVKPEKRPISVKGKYYQRIGNTTREISGEQLRDLFLDEEPWDQITNQKFSFDDIDIDEVQVFLKTSKKLNRLNKDSDSDNIESLFKKLKLIKEDKFTNASILLFGKDPQEYFPNATVKIGRFKDESTILGEHIITGNLFKQVRESEEQIKGFIEKRFVLSEKSFQRQEVWQYPLLSIREALLNALVHRNYFHLNVKTQIKIFDSRISIFNPGKLPSSLRIQDLKKPHSSYPRNSLIANIFFKVGLIEEWGSGIQRMVKAHNEVGLPEPEFEEMGETFVAKLFGSEFIDRIEQLSKNLSEWQNTAIKYVQKNAFIDLETYQLINGVSRLTAEDELKELTEKGIFSKTGKGLSAKYKIEI